MEKQEKLITLLTELKRNRFTGYIKVNFSQGGITKVEKTEDIFKKNELK